MNVLFFAALAATAAVTQNEAALASQRQFWVEATRISPGEAGAVAAAVERMARDKDSLVPAWRREDADLLVQVRLDSLRAETDGPEAQSGVGLSPTSPGPGPGDTSPSSASSLALIQISLLDVIEGESLFERSFRCRLPLAQGARLVDPALRANLSYVTDLMRDWAERPVAESASSTATRFGLSDSERAKAAPQELARGLYREGVRATLAGFDEPALALLAEAQPLFKQTGLRREEGSSWERLALLMASTGRELDKALTYAGQAVRIAREVSDPRAEARALTLLAVLEAFSANYPRAIELLMSARRQSQDQGEILTEAAALVNLAGLTALRGNFEQAREMQEAALTRFSEGASHPRAEGRLRLAMAVVQSHLDDRNRAVSLAELAEVHALARSAGDRALLRDVAFVKANVRFSTTDFRQLQEGELDTIRAYKISKQLGDSFGEAAALAFLGAWSHRLVRPAMAADYLARAQAQARDAGYLEIVTDSLQLLGEMAPNTERGLALLDDVLVLRREAGDLRGEVKTLSDMSRLLAGLEEDDLAWQRYEEAVVALERFVDRRKASPYAEDIRESFITTLKSLVTSRTELPYLERYLVYRHLLIRPDASWTETETEKEKEKGS